MFLSVNDFATAIGIKPGTVRQHLKRSKLFKSGNMIDTDFEPNREYIMEQTNGKGLKVSEIPQKITSKTNKGNTDKPKVKPHDKNHKISKPVLTEFDTMAMQKRAAELEKIKAENELKNLQLQKFKGQHLPVDLSQKIFTVNIRSIFHNFETEAENLASIYCEILGGNREHLSEMTKRMREMLQKSIEETKKKTALEIKNVIKEYSMTSKRP
ncbi:hypothetical protein N9Y48_00215 [Zobellia sp.]|nr:hypothetical protein [Zobellia sp.]